ncbi:MAG: hypothetical protein ACAH59_03900 [Pseudobdellovibrionaceae bacterium]
MDFRFQKIIFAATLFISLQSLGAQRQPALSPPLAPPANGSLFSSNESLRLRLTAPLSQLFSYKKEGYTAKKKSVDGVIAYEASNHRMIEIPVKIHLKGFSSLVYCPFPKLELKFDDTKTANTLFAGTKTVDLNTHCAEANDESVETYFRASFNNHREAFIYRLMEILSIPTLKARPVFIQYTDLGRDTKVMIQKDFFYQAFFLEDMADFRRRSQVKEIKGANSPMKDFEISRKPEIASQFQFQSVSESPQLDKEDIARAALFQFLVGNFDWFIKMNPHHTRSDSDSSNLWNTKIIETSEKKWFVLMQDFSLSGFVSGISYPLPINQITYDVVDKATQHKIQQSFLSKKSQIEAALLILKDDPQFETLKDLMDKSLSKIENL